MFSADVTFLCRALWTRSYPFLTKNVSILVCNASGPLSYLQAVYTQKPLPNLLFVRIRIYISNWSVSGHNRNCFGRQKPIRHSQQKLFFEAKSNPTNHPQSRIELWRQMYIHVSLWGRRMFTWSISLSTYFDRNHPWSGYKAWLP